MALPRTWQLLRMESSVSRDACSHVPWMWGLSGPSTLVYVWGLGAWGGRGVVGGEEGFGAVDHADVGRGVVVGGGL